MQLPAQKRYKYIEEENKQNYGYTKQHVKMIFGYMPKQTLTTSYKYITNSYTFISC